MGHTDTSVIPAYSSLPLLQWRRLSIFSVFFTIGVTADTLT